MSGTVWSNILKLHLGVVGNIILQVRRLRLRDAIYPKVIQLGYGEAGSDSRASTLIAILHYPHQQEIKQIY